MVLLEMKEGSKCVSTQHGELSMVKGGTILMGLSFAGNLVTMIGVSGYV